MGAYKYFKFRFLKIAKAPKKPFIAFAILSGVAIASLVAAVNINEINLDNRRRAYEASTLVAPVILTEQLSPKYQPNYTVKITIMDPNHSSEMPGNGLKIIASNLPTGYTFDCKQNETNQQYYTCTISASGKSASGKNNTISVTAFLRADQKLEATKEYQLVPINMVK